MWSFLWSVCQFLYLCSREPARDESTRVCLPGSACYVGSTLETGRGSEFRSYQGIRYAKPPTGNLRFKLPERFEAEDEEEDVSGTSKVKCRQFSFIEEEMIGQEDCLLLNVYVPEKIAKSNQSAPVMVWIHGGGFVQGSGTFDEYGPNMFMEEEIVLVTVNYRLGPFGFLTTVTEEIPGNMGLWDQALALRWVNENIQNFGGDPDQVTIFGESAGSVSVSLLMVAPSLRGLFSRVIMDSGVFHSPSYHHQTVKDAARISQTYLWEVGCDGFGPAFCLQGKEAEEIMEAYRHTPESWWMPVPDHSFKSDPLFPEEPSSLLSAVPPEIDVLIGTTEDEGIISLTGPLTTGDWESFRDSFNTTGTKDLLMIPFADQVTKEDIKKTDKIIEFYVGSYDKITEENKYPLIDLHTDSVFRYGTYKMINQLVGQGSRVYAWILTHQGQHSVSKWFGVDVEGVNHADELLYMWDPVFEQTLQLEDEDAVVQAQIVSSWANFVKFGDPTPPGSSYSWSAVQSKIESQDQQWYFNISGSDSAMAGSPEIYKRFKIWEEVLED